jgi:hypothetical protein
LALEYAAQVRRYADHRKDVEDTLVRRGLGNRTVVEPVLEGTAKAEDDARERLEGRWYREVSPDEIAALDGILVTNSAGDPAEVTESRASKTVRAGEIRSTAQIADGVVDKADATTRHTKGAANELLIAGLLEHHKYSNGGCGNFEPVKNNELADRLKVGRSTASDFFIRAFNGYQAYVAACLDGTRLCAKLKIMAQDYSDVPVFGGTPPGEGESEDD